MADFFTNLSPRTLVEVAKRVAPQKPPPREITSRRPPRFVWRNDSGVITRQQAKQLPVSPPPKRSRAVTTVKRKCSSAYLSEPIRKNLQLRNPREVFAPSKPSLKVHFQVSSSAIDKLSKTLY